MSVSIQQQRRWHPGSDRPWPVSKPEVIHHDDLILPEPEPVPDPNQVVFLGRSYSRRPAGLRESWICFLGCLTLIAFTWTAISASQSPSPVATQPAQRNPTVRSAPQTSAQPVFWPVNSNPATMCRLDGGVLQVQPAGGATKQHPMPASSTVSCNDGSDQSVTP